MKEKFQIFGSESSEDYDVMVFVDNISNTEDSKNLCIYFNSLLAKLFKDNNMPIKELNSNIAIIKDGIITKIHKGTTEEANNSLYLTYDFHKQFYPNQIVRLLERDIDIKIMRCARSILMLLSRSQYRDIVKFALRSDFIKKIKTLENIDYSTITEDDIKERLDFRDAIKMICFQLGQTIALIDGVELYTKESISNRFPDLEDMLYRKSVNMVYVEKYKQDFIRKCKLRLSKMKTFEEYKI